LTSKWELWDCILILKWMKNRLKFLNEHSKLKGSWEKYSEDHFGWQNIWITIVLKSNKNMHIVWPRKWKISYSGNHKRERKESFNSLDAMKCYYDTEADRVLNSWFSTCEKCQYTKILVRITS
jgi:hypothetical protein